MTDLVVACGLLISILGVGGIRPVRRRRWMRNHPAPTFVFADLAGHTALTEQLGDEAAALVARQFVTEMSAASRRYGAWHVKSLGDGVMIWGPPTPPTRSRSPSTR
jgi:class 3 adenylate cyclase